MIRILAIFLLSQVFVITLEAQKLSSRISPSLQAKPAAYFQNQTSLKEFIIEMRPGSPAPQVNGVVVRPAGRNMYIMTATGAAIWKIMSSDLTFLYLDEQLRPSTETGVLVYDMTANRINVAWNEFQALKGEGQVVSVKENRMDTNDIDLLRRSVTSPFESPIDETHATAMTTLIAGAGNSFYTGKGVAPRTRYSSSDFITVLPDTPTYYTSLGIEVQNHSYGTGLQNFYGINARAFDLSVQQNPNLLHVFSAGNSGSQTPGLGIYAGLDGFANITGNMKMAKNILLAGAMDSAGNVPLLSSKGPLYDGRIAPHLVAFGEDGTSGAAALASGVALLLQQQYKQLFSSQAPAALIRTVLINSADDVDAPGPDFRAGFGKMNALMAFRTVKENRFFNGELAGSSLREYRINVPAGTALLKITLGWNEPAVAAGSEKALLNDLDLELGAPGGSVVLPWTLNSYPAVDSLLKPAARKKDTLNTNEQISMADPAAGEYIIRVRSGSLRTPNQLFSVAFQLEAKDSFSWSFPSRDELALAGNESYLRWGSWFSNNNTGSLEVSRNQGPWELISNSVDLRKGYYPYRYGDSLHEVKFRMTAGSSQVISEDLLVSPALINRYGYVCDTSILHYWNRVPRSSGYRLFRLVSDSMQAIVNTVDTSTVTRKTGSAYFAVATLFNDRLAVRGPATDYTKQGVGCIIDRFTASLQLDNSAMVRLTLGSLFKIKKVEIIKLSANNKVLFKIEPPSSRTIEYIDRKVDQGLNIYQAVVYLDDGSVVYSSRETVYFLNGGSFLVYPNPARRGEHIHVLSELPEDQKALIYDNVGRLVLRVILNEKVKPISTVGLAPGIYYIRVMQGNAMVKRISFVIQ
jgi:hypothetical protein